MKKNEMNITEITKEQQELLDTGHVIPVSDTTTYYYLPFVYKRTEGKDMLEVIQLKELPEELTEKIENELKKRNG